MVAGATSRPLTSVPTATCSRGAPSSNTSYMQPLALAETPKPLVAFPWGSISTIRIFSPNPARYAARLIAVVLFPTPPFWFTMATTVAIAGILARLGYGLPRLHLRVSRHRNFLGGLHRATTPGA